MATLSINDILKRKNVETFHERVSKGGFQLMKDSAPVLPSTGRIKINGEILSKKTLPSASELRGRLEEHISGKNKIKTFEVELLSPSKRFVRVRRLFKDKSFGGVGGKSSGAGSERQELGLISALKEAAKTGKKTVTPFGSAEFITGASKREGLSKIGKEPYIDIYTETNKNKYGVSNKGESAPSLAGGGVAGLKIIVPDLVKRLYKTLSHHITKDLGLDTGSAASLEQLPDFFIEIPKKYMKQILIGTAKMGGPIDLMYVGPMNVKYSFTKDKIILNGKFFTINQYLKKVPTLFFRVRKRDVGAHKTLLIDLKTKNREGYPVLFVRPDNKKNVSRIVITDKVTSKGTLLKLK